MKRTLLFLATNLAIVVMLSMTMKLLGVEPYLNEQGLNLTSLLIFAAVMGMGGAFISLAISKWSAKRMVGAQVISSPQTAQQRWLVETVRVQAQMAGIGMPEVAIYESADINAFATGMNKNNALVAVSSGLLNSMSKDEAEAVLAHEVSHVANGDMVTLALIQGVVNTFVMFLSRVVAYAIDKLVFKTERGTGPAFFITMIVAELILGVLASIIVMWFSRQREFKADTGGARLASRNKMIAALEKLKQGQQPLPEKMAAFGISGGKASGFKRLFMSHPPLEERIQALKQAT
jgi:heat shock protein HtpX